MKCIATSYKAFSDHGNIHKGLVQLTKDGKFLNLKVNLLPIGLKHKQICKFILHKLINNSHKAIEF